MLIIRGVNVFPSQIESVLMESQTTRPHYQLEVDRKGEPGYPDREGGNQRNCFQ